MLSLSEVSAAGVKVAVHVTPLSLLTTSVSVPLGIVRSDLMKSVTTPLKVKVTVEVSKIPKTLSVMKMLAVGSVVFIAKLLLSTMPDPLLLFISMISFISNWITLVEPTLTELIVSVDVQVLSPLLGVKSPSNTPIGTVKLSTSTYLTGSLKVTVTKDVWPLFSTPSLTTMVAVGAFAMEIGFST